MTAFCSVTLRETEQITEDQTMLSKKEGAPETGQKNLQQGVIKKKLDASQKKFRNIQKKQNGTKKTTVGC